MLYKLPPCDGLQAAPTKRVGGREVLLLIYKKKRRVSLRFAYFIRFEIVEL